MFSLRAFVLAAVLCTSQGSKVLRASNLDVNVDTPVHFRSETKLAPPMFDSKTMPPPSGTLKCIICLTVQYFVIYTVLAVVRTVNALREEKMLGLQRMMETACTTVTYAPMLSVLFVGTRMRAIQLSQGNTVLYDLPQWWVELAMCGCAAAVACQVLLVMIIPTLTGEAEAKTDEDGNLDMSNIEGGGYVAMGISAVRYLIMLGLYGGFTAVIVGCFLMQGPAEIWGAAGAPPVSPALFSTILLTATFFTVYLLVAVCKTYQEIRGPSEIAQKLNSSLTLAKFTVNFAPMLAILFIGARIRALQMDPKNGNPQRWAQLCFYLCTASLVVQTLMVILMPFATTCEVKQGQCEGDVTFVTENPTVNTVLTGVRYTALAAMYGGFSAVVASVFMITHPTNPALTPPVSPAMLCTMNLSVQYFAIYLGLFACNTAKQYTEHSILTKTMAVLEAGQKTVMYAPMLSVLFWATRMRALQLAKGEDGTIPPQAGPPRWAQDAMYAATWSVVIQLVMAMVVPALGDDKIEMDENGAVKAPESANKYVAATFEGMRYVSMVAMYGGAAVVMASIFTMTPEGLPPYNGATGLMPAPPAR